MANPEHKALGGTDLPTEHLQLEEQEDRICTSSPPPPHENSVSRLTSGLQWHAAGMSSSHLFSPAAATLFQGSSSNTLSNVTANVAHGDIHIHNHINHSPNASPNAPQGQSVLQSSRDQRSWFFSYILSIFPSLYRSVTLASPDSEALSDSLAVNSPPATDQRDSDARDLSPKDETEGIKTEVGSLEITPLEDLDLDHQHQPTPWYKSPDLPNGLTLSGIYIRKLYPNGDGFPCPNPSPEGPPIRIGDIGKLTSSGFTVLDNLAQCQLPWLQGCSSFFGLADVYQHANYFKEGQSVTGGVSVREINRLPDSSTIRNIQYHCHDPQGAVLAVTSPAQLETLTPLNRERLRAWLSKYGMKLMESLDHCQTDPLYIVTGQVLSSSWATATYSQLLPKPDDSLILTHYPTESPPYQWSKPGNSRARSQCSVNFDSEGQRAVDQSLFLRGFLLTPSQKDKTYRSRHGIKSGSAGQGHTVGGSAGSSSNTGSFNSSPGASTSTRSEAVLEMSRDSGTQASGNERLSVKDVPSIYPMDFYPLHCINKRLLELTGADLAIAHDDDWRLELVNRSQPSFQDFHSAFPIDRGKGYGSGHTSGAQAQPSPDLATQTSGSAIAAPKPWATSISVLPDPQMTLNNVCQDLFGQGVALSTYRHENGTHQAVASVWSSVANQTMNLGFGQGNTGALAKSSAAVAALHFLKRQYPANRLLGTLGP